MTAPVLAVANLTVAFPTDEGPVEVVRKLSYELAQGEVLAIVGESGSGKSVSALALLGLLPAQADVSGSVTIGGRELVGASYEDLSQVRGRRISIVPQDSGRALNPVRTVGSQLAEDVAVHQLVSSKEAALRAIELLERAGIPDARRRSKGYPHELSGGLRQRAVIAMALANEPEVLIADEPTNALDVSVQAEILELLAQARAATDAAMLLITHDLGLVAGMADRVMVMYAGRAVEIGGVDDIFYRPRMPYTMGLLASIPRAGMVTGIPGVPPALGRRPTGCPFFPRCSYRVDICQGLEPELLPESDPGHLAACHVASTFVGEGVPPQQVPAASRLRLSGEAD